MNESDQLVKMANQIADNFSFHDDASARVADHIQRFWAPSMRQQLARLAESGDAGIKPVVREAVGQLGLG